MAEYKLKREDKNQINLALIVFSLLLLIVFCFSLYNLSGYFIKKDFASLAENDGDTIAQAGQFGDLVGGLVGTLFSIIGTIFLVYTLSKQQSNFKKERFENRYFELIKIYRDTVNEMNIADLVTGRKCFLSMYKEFKEMYGICEKVYFENNLKIYENTPAVFRVKYLELKEEDVRDIYVKSQICSFAYRIFFSGVGLNSELYLDNGNKVDLEFFNLVKKMVEEYQENYTSFFEKKEEVMETHEGFLKYHSNFDLTDPYTNSYSKKSHDILLPIEPPDFNKLKFKVDKLTYAVSYYPFDGHISRLGHYYRLLFQIVRYVVSFKDVLFDKDEIYEYLKILRAQMSNHEQILLYYNGVTGTGGKWLCDDKNGNANYFVDYKMIHNVPFPLANFGIDITREFASERAENPDLFEWDWAEEV